MTPEQRERFDALVQDAIESLPPRFREALEEIPVVVVDRPDRTLVAELRREGVLPPASEDAPANTGGGELSDEELMGLHTGIAITDRSVGDSGTLPGVIHIFRDGVVGFAGGWDQPHAEEEIYEEVRVTLLHELGHHFGLDEDDLDRLGYG